MVVGRELAIKTESGKEVCISVDNGNPLGL